jgi:hypothetical protein
VPVGEIVRAGEAAAGAAEQYRNRAVEGVGDRQVGVVVAVEVAYGD